MLGDGVISQVFFPMKGFLKCNTTFPNPSTLYVTDPYSLNKSPDVVFHLTSVPDADGPEANLAPVGKLLL